MSKRHNLQVVTEWIGGLIKAGNPVVTAMSPVWSDKLNSPGEVCEFTMTLDTDQKFNVRVTRTTPETEIRDPDSEDEPGEDYDDGSLAKEDRRNAWQH